MASGKETPRQKMISMMYLVLTALLALNVSKEILKGFVTVDENLTNSKLILDENNLRVKKAFEDYVKQGNYEAKPYLLKAIEAQQEIRKVNSYIDSLKVIIACKTEGIELKDTSRLRFMQRLDDYDTPTYILIGSDETKPINHAYSALHLKSKLTSLHNQLITMLNDMQKNDKTKLDEKDMDALKKKLSTILPTDKGILENDVKQTWEIENFYHLPMAAVITNLDKIQADIKNVESEFLHVFANASSKFTFKIDKLHADVVAPSAYVLAGQPFKANIVLGASSSELTEERMKVLLDAEYDTVAKKLIKPGNPLNIADGMGKFETVTNGVGQKSLKGVIIYKNPRGTDEYYPFNYDYTVAPPFSTISADKMNVFYAGIDNEISASAAGFSPNDIKVNINGCGANVKQTSAGKYIVTAKTTGTCVVTISAKTKDGSYKQQGDAKIFRVKGIPPPVAKLSGKLATSNLELTRNEINAIGSLGAESPGFMFPANMVVKSFVVEVPGRSPFVCSSNKFTDEAKRALMGLRSGQKAYIDDIKVQMPTGEITKISMAQIKLKS